MNTTDEIRVINQQIRKLRNERKTLWLSFVCDLFRQKQYGEWKKLEPQKDLGFKQRWARFEKGV